MLGAFGSYKTDDMKFLALCESDGWWQSRNLRMRCRLGIVRRDPEPGESGYNSRLSACGFAAYFPTISINRRAFRGARVLTSLLK